MIVTKQIVLALSFTTMTYACGAPRETSPEWRGFQRDDWPDGWSVVDGALVLDPTGEGVDLISTEKYADFELTLDYVLEPGSNSGIFFRVSEEEASVWFTGPELQVLDDEAQPPSTREAQLAGACYDLYPPAARRTRPAGTPVAVRLLVLGDHVEHWLDGEKLVEYEIGSADWNARVAGSKFAEHARFAAMREGHIALQDHGDPVRFENVTIVRR